MIFAAFRGRTRTRHLRIVRASALLQEYGQERYRACNNCRWPKYQRLRTAEERGMRFGLLCSNVLHNLPRLSHQGTVCGRVEVP
jgi:hypothetical protein